MRFTELALSEPLQQAVGALGYEETMPIQAQAIPPALEALVSEGPDLFYRGEWAQRLAEEQAAQEAGLPFGYRTMTYNSRWAHELSKWADSQGKGDALRRAVYRAYFVDGQNIGRRRVLVELAEAAGLAADEARRVDGAPRRAPPPAAPRPGGG